MGFNMIDMDKLCGRGLDPPKRHGNLLPNHVRAIICGPSNSGKTNLMLNLLTNESGVRFANVYVFSKSLYQSKYKLLESIIQDLPEIRYFAFSENDQVPHPSDLEPNSVMIFDDVSCEKQNNIRNYFTMGRHNDVDTFYLCQTYSRVPKQLIRDNANFIVLFKQDEKNLRHVYNDHVNTDMSFSTFKEMCSTVWNEGHKSFIVIDKEKDIHEGRYRYGMDVNLTFVTDI